MKSAPHPLQGNPGGDSRLLAVGGTFEEIHPPPWNLQNCPFSLKRYTVQLHVTPLLSHTLTYWHIYGVSLVMNHSHLAPQLELSGMERAAISSCRCRIRRASITIDTPSFIKYTPHTVVSSLHFITFWPPSKCISRLSSNINTPTHKRSCTVSRDHLRSWPYNNYCITSSFEGMTIHSLLHHVIIWGHDHHHQFEVRTTDETTGNNTNRWKWKNTKQH